MAVGGRRRGGARRSGTGLSAISRRNGQRAGDGGVQDRRSEGESDSDAGARGGEVKGHYFGRTLICVHLRSSAAKMFWLTAFLAAAAAAQQFQFNLDRLAAKASETVDLSLN